MYIEASEASAQWNGVFACVFGGVWLVIYNFSVALWLSLCSTRRQQRRSLGVSLCHTHFFGEVNVCALHIHTKLLDMCARFVRVHSV